MRVLSQEVYNPLIVDLGSRPISLSTYYAQQQMREQQMREQLLQPIETLENIDDNSEMTHRDTWFPINVNLGGGTPTTPTTPTLTDQEKRKRAIWWGVGILFLLIVITLLIVFMRKKK